MKTVIFFRHGKSNWEADYDHDHDRPLAKRGKKAALKMGCFLAEIDQVPDVAVTSTAVRAQETLRRAAEAGGWLCPVQENEALYGATLSTILDVIRKMPEEITSLMLVGHEPTWSDMVAALIGGGDVLFPTAAMARVDVEVDAWKDVEMGDGQLVWFVPPRLFS